MNTPVSFPIAKLLKEKGFDKITDSWYDWTGKEIFKNGRYFVDITPTFAPTIAEVVMWLYEKYEIWIGVFSTDDVLMFSYKISSKQGHNYSPNYNSPTEAYEAAIEYVLENLLTVNLK